MKLEIDTVNKTVKIADQVNLNDLVTMVKGLFPDGQWKEYSILTNVEIVWSNPIWVDPAPAVNPCYPWQNPFTYSIDVRSDPKMQATFCVEG
jgi:hypothetical protein